MVKIEAPTLEEAYELAARKLSCSVTELDYEIVQYPSTGIFGIFKKHAVIVATRKIRDQNSSVSQVVPETAVTETKQTIEKSADQTVAKSETKSSEDASRPVKEKNEDKIVDKFFEADTKTHSEQENRAVAYEIEAQLKKLMETSCFDIDTVEVDVMDSTAYVFIDGEDAALLIGKEGYRYNALSYMLFNWIHSKYNLFLKLEIAAFLTTQEEMIRNYIKPVIENVNRYGRGKTRFLDGVLVQIALEQLREAFPDKYVAIKTAKSGKRFVVIDEFHPKTHV